MWSSCRDRWLCMDVRSPAEGESCSCHLKWLCHRAPSPTEIRYRHITLAVIRTSPTVIPTILYLTIKSPTVQLLNCSGSWIQCSYWNCDRVNFNNNEAYGEQAEKQSTNSLLYVLLIILNSWIRSRIQLPLIVIYYTYLISQCFVLWCNRIVIWGHRLAIDKWRYWCLTDFY